MAREFARTGADVMISSRTEQELRAAAAEIAEGLDVRVEWMVVDMVDRWQVDGLASEAVSRLGAGRHPCQQRRLEYPRAD